MNILCDFRDFDFDFNRPSGAELLMGNVAQHIVNRTYYASPVCEKVSKKIIEKERESERVN